jgi:hypothetical protein
MNGDTFDAEPAMNDGIFVGGPGPEFEADREGLAASALRLDGVDDAVLVRPSNGLPLHAHAAYSVAMWVRGGGAQVERSVWAESSGAALEGALFAIGPDFRGGTGRADVFIRDATGAPILNHVRSQGTAFDGAWHHLAWVDAGGEALLYIDGHPDATSFRYEKTALALDATAIGGAVLGGAACCSFEGLLDDVRAYTYALSRAEVEALAGVSGIPFHRGDANDDGGVNLTDPIYVLNFLFLGGPRPACAETADANDDGIVNLTDPVVLLNFLFLGGSPPADPGVPGEGGGPCGLDPPGSTDLGCGSYSGC